MQYVIQMPGKTFVSAQQDMLVHYAINKLMNVYHHHANMAEHVLTVLITILVIVQIYSSMDQIVKHVYDKSKIKK
jgi:hypothetical protein